MDTLIDQSRRTCGDEWTDSAGVRNLPYDIVRGIKNRGCDLAWHGQLFVYMQSPKSPALCTEKVSTCTSTSQRASCNVQRRQTSRRPTPTPPSLPLKASPYPHPTPTPSSSPSQPSDKPHYPSSTSSSPPPTPTPSVLHFPSQKP